MNCVSLFCYVCCCCCLFTKMSVLLALALASLPIICVYQHHRIPPPPPVTATLPSFCHHCPPLPPPSILSSYFPPGSPTSTSPRSDRPANNHHLRISTSFPLSAGPLKDAMEGRRLRGTQTLTEPPRWREEEEEEEERDQPPRPLFAPPTSPEPAHTPLVLTSLESLGPPPMKSP